MDRGQNAYIASLGLATPPFRIEQKLAGEIIINQYSDRLSKKNLSLTHKLFSHPSIRYRSYAIDDPESLFNESPDARVARFTRWAVDLSAEAVTRALDEAGVDINEVRGIVVNTCTGYICPGISTYLIEKLGLSKNISAYDLAGSGCGGAIPNLQISGALAGRLNGPIVSVSVEICSATFQMDNELSLIVSNALFGDGAAAAVVRNIPGGFELTDSASIYVPGEREHIRYVHKNGELHNQLSMNLHLYVKKAAASVVDDLLTRNQLKKNDIDHWALHTGGEKIINAIRDELGLSEEQLAATRLILSDYGNMSSPTVLFVLKRLEEAGINKGDRCVMLAFGAGLSAHAYLLKKV
jgi:predicted naringenin-chalcone synthase